MDKLQVQAAITDGKGNCFIDEVEVGQPGADEVLVKIKAAGICHTDYDSMSWGTPLVLGHEGAGEVVATGPEVSSIAAADRVLLNWAIPCGTCLQCNLGNQHLCENNSPVTGRQGFNAGHAAPGVTSYKGNDIQRSFNLGTLSAYTVVKERAITRIEGNIPYPSACIMGCGVMTGFGSVVNAARVTPGSSVAVLGVGGVGLNVVQGARIAGAARIIAIDLSSHRLDISKTFGATHQVQVEQNEKGLDKAIEEVKSLTAGRGADYAFECTGNPLLGAAPLALVRNAGTAVQVSGIEQEITIDMNLFEWDKIYMNPLYGKCRPSLDFPRLFDLYAKGDLLLDEMISKTYSLDNINRAFDDMLNGRIAKGVIAFE